MRCYRLLVALMLQLCALLMLAAPQQVQAQVKAQAQQTNITAALVAERPAPAGGTVTLAMKMQPASGWHGYWSNPGDAGFGMSLEWTLPAGASVSEPRYPVPETLVIEGLMNHVYNGDYAVLIDLKLPKDAKPGQRLPISVKAQWLACTDKVCVPERATLASTVQVGAAAGPDSRFDAWRALLPAPLGAQARFALEPARARIAVPLPASVALHDPHFFAAQDKAVDYAAVQTFSRKGDMLVIEIPRARAGSVAPQTLSGVLRLRKGAPDGLMIAAEPGTVPPPGIPLRQAGSGGPLSLPWLLLAALAGGLLLNIMPCVFPILSLKALSLARAGESEAEARREGLAYTAGVVLACALLGALMLALRAGGSQIGWAFQLQEPLVVAALLLLAAAITANLLGLFEFAVPGFANAGSPQGAFATGLLAAFAATPCTGPFMAAAMGAALLLPVLPAMLLFVALGLGLALPFLAIAFVPALRRRLPRPGAWMVWFRKLMAVPMGLTALALVWLASRLSGLNFAMAASALSALLLLALVWAGKRQRRGLGSAAMLLAAVLAIAAVSALALPRLAVEQVEHHEGVLPTQPFSAAALARARKNGKPVFVWMTADWCLTCKVNERVAIEREDVRDAFARGGVTVLRGDWTRRDAEITRYLTAQGAAGVPLYVWYDPGGEAQQLPQVLTPGVLIGLAGG